MAGYCWPSTLPPANSPPGPSMLLLVVDMTELWLGRRRSALLLMLTGLVVVDVDNVLHRSCASAEDPCPAVVVVAPMTFFLGSRRQLKNSSAFFPPCFAQFGDVQDRLKKLRCRSCCRNFFYSWASAAEKTSQLGHVLAEASQPAEETQRIGR